MNKLPCSAMSLFLGMYLCIFFGAAHGQSPSSDSLSKNTVDSLGAGAPTDSAHKNISQEFAPYQPVIPVMRRDVPRSADVLTTPKPAREKFVAPQDTVKPKAAAESIVLVKSTIPSKTAGKSSIKKSSILLAIGACALIGGGIAAYLFASAPSSGSAASGGNIPPPPGAPSNFAPSP